MRVNLTNKWRAWLFSNWQFVFSMVSLTSSCAKKEKRHKMEITEGLGLGRREDKWPCERAWRKGVFPDTECPRDPFVLEIHRVMILSVSLLFKQLQPAVTACMGSFMEKQSFQTLAFPYNFHPGYIPGSALSRLHLFPCLVSVSPLSYPLLCSAMGALEPAVSFLLMEDQCVAMARSVWMCLALQHWSVALWIQTRCVWCSHSCLQRKKMQHESGQTINYYFHCLSERSKIQIFC